MSASISRRRFLWAAGGVMAASMLACGGSVALMAAPTPAVDYGDSQRDLVPPAAEAFFTGAIDPQKLNLMELMMVKMVKSPTGDLRNWEAIRSWADEAVTLQA